MIIWKQNAFYSSKSQQAFPPKKLQLGVLDSHNKGKEVSWGWTSKARAKPQVTSND